MPACLSSWNRHAESVPCTWTHAPLVSPVPSHLSACQTCPPVTRLRLASQPRRRDLLRSRFLCSLRSLEIYTTPKGLRRFTAKVRKNKKKSVGGWSDGVRERKKRRRKERLGRYFTHKLSFDKGNPCRQADSRQTQFRLDNRKRRH